MEKVIGILGGMGPEATSDCFEKIIKNTPAVKDQEHLRVVIESNPKVPDRTAAILGQGPSPVPVLAQGMKVLEQAGADFIIIPCVSVHFYLDELRTRTNLPILSIFDAVVENIQRHPLGIKTLGLLGTTGTIRGALFQERLSLEGIDTIVCEESLQSQVMDAIYEIKKGGLDRDAARITHLLSEAAKGLLDRGAQGIVAGCTEIPLALKQEHVPAPYFDAVLALALSAIRLAGKEVREMHLPDRQANWKEGGNEDSN